MREAEMVEISDLAGLKKPLTRLIEVVTQGIGAVSAPYLTRKNAAAKAYEIKIVSAALAESKKIIEHAAYSDGQVNMAANKGLGDSDQPNDSSENRILTRIAYQEAKKQVNLESIIQHAAENLKNVNIVDHDSPDADWTLRFFRIAEDVSTEEMQALWGKVLAGEIIKPGAFSLRSLDALRNMTRKDAEVFVKISHAAFSIGTKLVLPHIVNFKVITKLFGITFEDIMHLKDIGLIFAVDISMTVGAKKENSSAKFLIGKTCVYVESSAKSNVCKFGAYDFTGIGKELFRLIEPSIVPPEYLNAFSKFFQSHGFVVKTAEVVVGENMEAEYKDFQDIATPTE